MAHLHIQNLTFTYAGADSPCLSGVNLGVEKGEYILLCGRSGSGKSTLLRHLKPVLTPHGRRQGQITFDGAPLQDMSPRDQGTKIGFVMQDPQEQIVTDQVWHELAFGLENLGTDPAVMGLRVAEMASYFGLEHWFNRETETLSGGQKQLLNLASVMAMQPEVLILDEPTSQLDPIAAGDFLNTVRKINLELGTTVIMTEHRLEDIFPVVDRVVVMDQGRIVANGPPRQVGQALWQHGDPMLRALPTPVRVYFGAQGQGECPMTVREGRTWLSRALPAEKLTCTQLPEPEIPEGKPALELKEVWFRYEKNLQDVLQGVTFQVPTGSLYALVGGNGAGKSTLLKAICGICKPYRGKLRILGNSPEKGNCPSGLAMLPQDPKSLFGKTTVRQELEEMGADSQRAAKIARLCQIEHLLSAHPYDLSGGEQQRVGLAKVLLTQPKVLLLDEPTKGLDAFFKITLAGILHDLQKTGITILMVSHDIEFCAEYADFAGMFFNGQVISWDTPRRFFGDNSFYTTAANRMSRCRFRNAVTVADVVRLYGKNREGCL